MALDPLTTYTHVLLLCVLLVLTLQLSTSRTAAQDCGSPKTVINAKVNFTKFSEANMRYLRYICQDGYKRQAGTSNLAVCMFDRSTNKSYWKYGNISCIRDPSLPLTTHSTLMSSTTSELQMFTTTPLSTATVKAHQTRQTPKTTLSQQTQVPGPVSTTKITTKGYRYAGRQTTHSAGSQSTAILPTTVETMRVTTTQQPQSSEPAATSRKTTQSLPESTYTSTNETLQIFTNSYNTTGISDTSLWHQGKTAGSIAGVLMFLILLLGITIWIKYRKQHSQVPQDDPKKEHNSSADHEELEEEACNL